MNTQHWLNYKIWGWCKNLQASSETTATARNPQENDPDIDITIATTDTTITIDPEYVPDILTSATTSLNAPVPDTNPDADHQLDPENESSDLESKESSDPENHDGSSSDSNSGSEGNNGEPPPVFLAMLQCPGTLFGEVPLTRPEPLDIIRVQTRSFEELFAGPDPLEVPDGPNQAMGSSECVGCHSSTTCSLPCVCPNKCIAGTCNPEGNHRNKRCWRWEYLKQIFTRFHKILFWHSMKISFPLFRRKH